MYKQLHFYKEDYTSACRYDLLSSGQFVLLPIGFTMCGLIVSRIDGPLCFPNVWTICQFIRTTVGMSTHSAASLVCPAWRQDCLIRVVVSAIPTFLFPFSDLHIFTQAFQLTIFRRYHVISLVLRVTYSRHGHSTKIFSSLTIFIQPVPHVPFSARIQFFNQKVSLFRLSLFTLWRPSS